MKECRTWIFGYGSLMWNPGFAYHCWRPAMLRGYHRSYSMYSTRNRGTTGRPGMILSLSLGRQCAGRAFHVEPGQEQAALEYLDKREGVGRAHRRVRIPLHLMDGVRGAGGEPVSAGEGPEAAGAEGDGGLIHAHTYLPILNYTNYIHGIPMSRQAELIARGEGYGGSSFDYLRNLIEILAGMGIAEPELEKLFGEVRRIQGCTPPIPAPTSAPTSTPPPAPDR